MLASICEQYPQQLCQVSVVAKLVSVGSVYTVEVGGLTLGAGAGDMSLTDRGIEYDRHQFTYQRGKFF